MGVLDVDAPRGAIAAPEASNAEPEQAEEVEPDETEPEPPEAPGIQPGELSMAATLLGLEPEQIEAIADVAEDPRALAMLQAVLGLPDEQLELILDLLEREEVTESWVDAHRRRGRPVAGYERMARDLAQEVVSGVFERPRFRLGGGRSAAAKKGSHGAGDIVTVVVGSPQARVAGGKPRELTGTYIGQETVPKKGVQALVWVGGEAQRFEWTNPDLVRKRKYPGSTAQRRERLGTVAEVLRDREIRSSSLTARLVRDAVRSVPEQAELPIEEASGPAQAHTSLMVALYPEPALARKLALRGGESAEELHMTLTFHGKASEQKGTLDDLMAVVESWAAGCPPLRGKISGVGMFAAGPGSETPVTYLSLDLPDLPDQRERLVAALKAAGFPSLRDHGFTPHMTLAYGKRNPKVEPQPITFRRVTAAWGGEHRHAELRGEAVQEARIPVSAYVKRSPTGKIVHVDRHVRHPDLVVVLQNLASSRSSANQVIFETPRGLPNLRVTHDSRRGVYRAHGPGGAAVHRTPSAAARELLATDEAQLRADVERVELRRRHERREREHQEWLDAPVRQGAKLTNREKQRRQARQRAKSKPPEPKADPAEAKRRRAAIAKSKAERTAAYEKRRRAESRAARRRQPAPQPPRAPRTPPTPPPKPSQAKPHKGADLPFTPAQRSVHQTLKRFDSNATLKRNASGTVTIEWTVRGERRRDVFDQAGRAVRKGIIRKRPTPIEDPSRRPVGTKLTLAPMPREPVAPNRRDWQVRAPNRRIHDAQLALLEVGDEVAWESANGKLLHEGTVLGHPSANVLHVYDELNGDHFLIDHDRVVEFGAVDLDEEDVVGLLGAAEEIARKRGEARTRRGAAYRKFAAAVGPEHRKRAAALEGRSADPTVRRVERALTRVERPLELLVAGRAKDDPPSDEERYLKRLRRELRRELRDAEDAVARGSRARVSVGLRVAERKVRRLTEAVRVDLDLVKVSPYYALRGRKIVRIKRHRRGVPEWPDPTKLADAVDELGFGSHPLSRTSGLGVPLSPAQRLVASEAARRMVADLFAPIHAE